MTASQRRTTRAALTVVAVAGIGFTVPLLQASAESSPTASCLAAGNVWVLVENDDAISGGCADEFGTGFAALESAGFKVEADDTGFINKINGVPSDKGAEDWWAYAHSDADVAAWQFYEVGAAKSKPTAGSIEAWRLIHSYSAEDTFPSVTPAKLLADVESPSPSPSTEPTVTATTTTLPQPSVSPSATGAPSTIVTTPARPLPPHTGN